MLHKAVLAWIEKNIVAKREPDLYIGGREDTYMRRWYVIPRNPIFNIYYHHFLRSDFAEALHDHPWLFNASWLLDGTYTEHSFVKPTHRRTRLQWYQRPLPQRFIERIGAIPPEFVAVGPSPEIAIYEPLPKTKATRRSAGVFKLRWGAAPHRIELMTLRQEFARGFDDVEMPVKTLFITGPKVRSWGFYCKRAWKHWQAFLTHYGASHESVANKGCD